MSHRNSRQRANGNGEGRKNDGISHAACRGSKLGRTVTSDSGSEDRRQRGLREGNSGDGGDSEQAQVAQWTVSAAADTGDKSYDLLTHGVGINESWHAELAVAAGGGRVSRLEQFYGVLYSDGGAPLQAKGEGFKRLDGREEQWVRVRVRKSPSCVQQYQLYQLKP